jgi:hypothetical protein
MLRYSDIPFAFSLCFPYPPRAMAKRPTPKRHRPKSHTRRQHAVYVQRRIRKLVNRRNSPYAAPAEPKRKVEKSLKGITRIKA